MTILGDIYRDTRRAILTGRSIKAEDNKRVLAPDALKGYRLPLVYGNNDYLLSKTAAWVGFHIPNKPWGFLDENARRSYFYATMGVFSNIFPAEKDNAGHLIVTLLFMSFNIPAAMETKWDPPPYEGLWF